MVSLHTTTTLLGNPKRIDLSEIFTDVYVIDQISAQQRLYDAATGREAIERLDTLVQQKRQPLLRMARAEPRLFVLGKPGAGKSTFLKKIVLECCSGNLAKTPIFVELKALAESGLTLQQFLKREFEVCAFPDAWPFISRLLDRGNAILLFDGLDEVSNEDRKRKDVVSVVADFSRQFPKTNIVVTCRVATTEYIFTQFKYVEIADFSDDQQRAFVRKWYSTDPSHLELFLKGWGRQDSDGFRDLARTPLLLALLCLAFDSTLQFPARRVELYQEAFSALLRRWDSSRGIARDNPYRALSHVRKEQLLSRIAADMFFNSAFLITTHDLENLVRKHISEFPVESDDARIDPAIVIQSIASQHGLLVERAADLHAFSHLTFQEYLTARHIVENIHDVVMAKTLEERAFDDQWREVFMMVASLMNNGQPLLAILQRALAGILHPVPDLVAGLIDLRNIRQAMTAGHLLGAKVQTQPSVSIIETLHEQALHLAAKHNQDKHAESPIHRIRALLVALRNPSSKLYIWLNQTAPEVQQTRVRTVSRYLHATTVYSECLSLAVVASREKLMNVILNPQIR
ncbi:MAG: NACHT domain-containing protein [Casimicrobium sp.]